LIDLTALLCCHCVSTRHAATRHQSKPPPRSNPPKMKAFAGLSSDEDDSDEDMAPAQPLQAAGAERQPAADDEADEARAETRFRVELEFLQCLASPLYCQFLAQHDYLDDPKFLKFLDYLQYFRRPEYVGFVEYPHCFAFLDLLRESEKFRIDIRRDECRDWCHQQQFYGWQHQYKEEHVTPDLEPEGVEGDAWRAPLPDLSGFDHARYEAYLKETLGGSPTWFFSQETLGDDRVRAALVAAEGGDAAGAGA